MILSYTADELRRVKKILKRLDLEGDPNVIVIDADNRPKRSASKVSDQ